MIGYVTLGTNDLARAAVFYDALLAELGARRFMETERAIAWAISPDRPALGVCLPFDGQAARHGNGVMIALAVDGKELVDRIHARAIALGGRDEGAVGPRGEGFYGGYFRDPDGNKLNVFCTGR